MVEVYPGEEAEHLLKTIHLKELPTAISDATIASTCPTTCRGKSKKASSDNQLIN